MNYNQLILGLDVSGHPRRWLTLEDAVTYHAKNQVAWEFGSEKFIARGGIQNDGTQSVIETASVIAIKGQGFEVKRRDVPLTNRTLFGRDRSICAYCGKTFKHHNLSRDHIVPKSRGGLDVWTNVVTACKDCNCDKDDQLLSECGMDLLYVPYVPSFSEKLILENRFILFDQMEMLKHHLPKHSRLKDLLN